MSMCRPPDHGPTSAESREGRRGEHGPLGPARDMLRGLFEWWSLESEGGRPVDGSRETTLFDGPLFGLPVVRARQYETNFGLMIDEALSLPAALLRRGAEGADGGTSPRAARGESAEALGINPGHLGPDELARATPPAYARYVFAQMCAAEANRLFGCPIISFDEMARDPVRARRTLTAWLVGAGGESPQLGLQLVGGAGPADARGATLGRGTAVGAETPMDNLRSANSRPAQSGVAPDGPRRATGLATEVEVRELYYSHAGGFDSSRVVEGSEWRLAPLGSMWNDARAQPLEGVMAGFNTFVERPDGRVEGLAAEFEDALRVCPVGTCLTVVTTCRGGRGAA